MFRGRRRSDARVARMGGVGVRAPGEELVSASDLVAAGESDEDSITRMYVHRT
jgi:hypothetical protein